MATVYSVSVCIWRPLNPSLQHIHSIPGLCTHDVSSAQVHSFPIVRSFYLYICVYSPKSPLTTQCCDSALQHTRLHTATFFSSCWSPNGQAPHRTGRRAQARGLPSPSRQPGTRPCFHYESHIQQCPLQPAQLPLEP